MAKLRFIDLLFEDLLTEVGNNLVVNKATGARYLVKTVNPQKHKLVKPNLSAKQVQDFELRKQKYRSALGQQDIEKVRKVSPESLKAVAKTTAPADIGPESTNQAVGNNPKAEKKLATRMAQLGQVSAKYISDMKKLAGEVKTAHPDWDDKQVQNTVKSLAKERNIVAPPEYDLCSVSIPGTNLFCGSNKEIPRADMPQLKTKAVPNTPAWEKATAEAEKKGIKPEDVEVNAESAFLDYLEKKGVAVDRTQTMPPTEMKATQNQLNADKVAGMAWALYSNPDTKDPKHPLRQPLIVSNDGYVLDGHHRWAALATYDVMTGKKGNTEIPVIKVDMDIEDLVDTSNKFGDAFGLERKGMGAGAEGTGKSEKEAPKANKTSKPSPQKVKMAKNTLTDKVKQTFKDFAKNSKETAADILQTAKSLDKNDWLEIITGGVGDALKSSSNNKRSSRDAGFGGGRSGGAGGGSSF